MSDHTKLSPYVPIYIARTQAEAVARLLTAVTTQRDLNRRHPLVCALAVIDKALSGG